MNGELSEPLEFLSTPLNKALYAIFRKPESVFLNQLLTD